MIDASVVRRMTTARLRRNPISSLALVLLIALSAATAGAGVGSIVATSGATERLFAAAIAPDAVQMHVGEVDESAIERFAASTPGVLDQQVQTALQLPNADLVLAGTPDAARAGVMDLLLVTQNDRFDRLLGADGRPAVVGRGEIGIPDYYAAAYDLAVGDDVELRVDGTAHRFVVGDVVGDAQMGPSLVNSKRFLLSGADWDALRPALEPERIITFRLADGSADRFAEAYRAAGLPANGAAVDGSLLRLVTALADGVVASLSLLIGLLLVVITLLCLRTMILTALEEETPRIGMLRTLGYTQREVSGALLVGYAVHAAAGWLIGSALAAPLTSILVGDAGGVATDTGAVSVVLSTIGAALIASLIPLVLAARLLGRVRSITPLAALRGEHARASVPRRLRRFRAGVPIPVGVRLAIRGLTSRRMSSVLLVAMVAAASLLAALPVRLVQTIGEPDFVSVMGVGRSDLRVFVRAGADTSAEAVTGALRADPDVVTLAETTSYRVDVRVGAGPAESVAVEVGDPTVFPIVYTAGGAPDERDTVALSTLAAGALGVGVGDRVDVDGAASPLRVSGVYHDITNGGRSGKVLAFDVGGTPPLWGTVAVDLRPGVDRSEKAAELAGAHPGATVTELDRFVRFTLGDTVERLQSAAVVAWLCAAVLVLLVFALRQRLEIARDRTRLRLLRVLGWTGRDLRLTVLVQVAVPAIVGALLGSVVVEAIGPAVLGAMLSSFGGGVMPLAGPAVVAFVPALSVALAAAAGAMIAAIPLPALRDES